uniref:Uncharacterized protein n=1 Tax=Anopheles minimus TaxID=112268 RepID=A0A182WPH5_9DIPT
MCVCMYVCASEVKKASLYEVQREECFHSIG